jgi:hypothetical protein
MKRKLIITDKKERQLFEGARLATSEDLQSLYGKSNFGRILNTNGIKRIGVVLLNNYPRTEIIYQIRILDHGNILDGYGILKDSIGYYFKNSDEVFLNYLASKLEITNPEECGNSIDWDKTKLVTDKNTYDLSPMSFKLGESQYIDELFHNRLKWRFETIIKKESIDTVVVVFELFTPYCLPHIGFQFQRNGIFIKNEDLYLDEEIDDEDRDWYEKNHCVKILQNPEEELSLFLKSLK